MIKPKLDTERMIGITDSYFSKVNTLYGLDNLCNDIGLNKESIVLEIGSHNGVSTSLFAFYAKKVYAVDVWFSPKLKNEIMPIYKNINFIGGSSVSVIPTLENNYFDMIYIDGDHSYEAVKNDIKLSMSKLKQNGYLCGHDYDSNIKNDVYRAVNEILGIPEKVYEDQSWAFLL
jgi:predicted O-methyltransferase YrrM